MVDDGDDFVTVIYRPQSSVKSSVKTVDKTVDKKPDSSTNDRILDLCDGACGRDAKFKRLNFSD